MRPVILQTATRYMLPLIILLSFVVLLQGHDKPGGGFIGGLLAAAALALHGLAFGPQSTRAAIRVDLRVLIAAGLLIALGSALVSTVAAWLTGSGPVFMRGVWWTLAGPEWSGIPLVKVGTPLIFDLGVYLVVVGVALLMVLSLMEARE